MGCLMHLISGHLETGCTILHADLRLTSHLKAALPEDLQREVLEQERRQEAQRQREASPQANPASPRTPAGAGSGGGVGGGSAMDTASLIATLTPELRQVRYERIKHQVIKCIKPRT